MRKVVSTILSLLILLFFVWFPIEVKDTGIFNNWLMWLFWIIFGVILVSVPIRYGFRRKIKEPRSGGEIKGE